MTDCLNCGQESIGRQKNAKHCSDACRKCYKGKKFYHDNKHREHFMSKRKEYYADWQKTPKGCYTAHVHNAKKRGLEVRLSFDEWWWLWEPHWEQRGRCGLVMCRKGDQGHYEQGNVFIDTHSNNTAYANVNRRRSQR